MPFKWGSYDVKKIDVIEKGVSYEGKKAVCNGVTVFESQVEHTYNLDVYLQYYWGGQMQNREDWDGDWGDEYLKHYTEGEVKIGVRVAITRDGVPYTPTGNELQIQEYEFEVRVAHGSGTPTITAGKKYLEAWDTESINIQRGYYQEQWSIARDQQIDMYSTDTSGTYWWFLFVNKLSRFLFKGNQFSITNKYKYLKAPRDNWTTFQWTPMTALAEEKMGSYTFKIKE